MNLSRFFLSSILVLFLVGRAHSAVDFQNSDDRLTCGTATDILMYNASSSVTLWIYADSLGPSNLGRIISKAVTNTGLHFTLNTVAGSGQTLFFSVSGSTSLQKNGSNITLIGGWHHVAYTWDGTTNHTGVKLYVDGVELSYSSGANGSSLTDNSSGAILIGNRGGFDRGFDGRISEVYVYDRELTATEVRQNYTKTKRLGMQHGPRAYWSLNDYITGTVLDGKTFPDLTGFGHTCTGDNGANNTGLIAESDSILNLPD